MRLERFFPLSVLALGVFWASSIGGLRFTPIYEPLSIKAQKNSPPHIAFEEIIQSEKVHRTAANFDSKKISISLTALNNSSAPIYSRRIQVSEMLIAKSVEPVVAKINESSPELTSSQSWIQELSHQQAQRLQVANRKNQVLSQDWSGSSWTDLAKDVLEKSGLLNEDSSERKVYVATKTANGEIKTKVPSLRIGQNHSDGGSGTWTSQTYASNTDAGSQTHGSSFVETAYVQGPIEIAGGLAITNEHHIEVRLTDEGVIKEYGKVDLSQGLYSIQTNGSLGVVSAQLLSKDGKVLGEGSFKLSQVTSPQQGPKIKILPQPGFSGAIISAYNAAVMDRAPANTRATFIKGVSEVVVKKDEPVVMDNIAKGSTTVLRAAAPGHLQTATVIASGQNFKASLYPESMIKALQEIVSQQRAMSVEGSPTVIFGKVSMDGKPTSGITVSVESDPSLQPIYFDQLMIPNPHLQSTSENGIFAFISVAPGFHSLLANRGDSIFGYQNVVVEEGSVAQGDIETSMKFESIPLRIYDAFTGDAHPVKVTLQSLSEELGVSNGTSIVSLPQVSRSGMMRVQPEGTDYISARYTYNDKDAFIHAPLVRWSWLSNIKTYLKIDDAPSAGFIVGFVPDENFEAYLAGYDHLNPRQIVYFDMQGRILQKGKGIAGGGFIIYNVPEDTHEVVVVGERTQKIYSRVVPIDANSLSVLTFRE